MRTRFPSARIDWLITPENAELVRHHPALSGVVLFDREKLAHFGRNWSATMEPVRLLRQIRRGRYELVIDLHGQLRSALVTLATGAPVRIGFDRPVRPTRTESRHHELRNLPRHGLDRRTGRIVDRLLASHPDSNIRRPRNHPPFVAHTDPRPGRCTSRFANLFIRED